MKWAAREMSCLFDSFTGTPFDDLDAIDEHGLTIAPGGKSYPLPLVHRYGDAMRYACFSYYRLFSPLITPSRMTASRITASPITTSHITASLITSSLTTASLITASLIPLLL